MSYDEKLYAALGSAAAEAVRVARGVRPEHADVPTPDDQWTARETINHFVLWSAYALEMRGRREDIGDETTTRDFIAEPDWQDAYAAAFERALDVWAAPETWEGEINGMPAPAVAGMLLLETVLHGWDTAVLTGQAFECDAATAETVYGIVSEYAAMYREYKGFGEEVPVAADASVFDKALGLSGRNPNRTI